MDCVTGNTLCLCLRTYPVYLHVLLKLPSWKIVLFTLAGKISMSVCVLVAGKREDTVVYSVLVVSENTRTN